MTISFEVAPLRSRILGEYPRQIVDDATSCMKNGFQYSPAYRRRLAGGRRAWDGRIHLLNPMAGTLPTGAVPLAVAALQAKGHACSLKLMESAARLPIVADPTEPLGGLTPRDYQLEICLAVDNGCLVGQRGVVRSATGCHRAGQGILLYDGSIVAVEQIRVGDLLMGPDGAPREVLSLAGGVGQMYEVVPVKGEPFVVNEDHILTLVRTREAAGGSDGTTVDVSVRDYLSWAPWKKHRHKLFRVGVDFKPRQDRKDWLDPYWLGLLLGDGSWYGTPGVTTNDPEIVSSVELMAAHYGCFVRKTQQPGASCETLFITSGSSKGGRKSGRNRLTNELRRLGLHGTSCADKFVPQRYLTASRASRLQLLAGLLDTDGSYTRGGYDFISKSQRLADATAFLARSLGLAAYVSQCQKSCGGAHWNLYWRVSISGDCSAIPCRIPRKQAAPRLQKKDVLRTGFTLRKLGSEEFYGFTLNGDGRYLLRDFTVTHNSGKTLTTAMILRMYGERGIVLVHGQQLVDQTRDELARFLGENLVGLVMGSDFHPARYTVTSVDTVGSRLKAKDPEMLRLLQSCRVLVADEAHRVGGGESTFQQAFDACPNAVVRLGLSGTPFKKEVDVDLLLMSRTGPLLIDVPPDRLQNVGHLCKADLRIYEISLPAEPHLSWREAMDFLVFEHEERTAFLVGKVMDEAEAGRVCLIVGGNSVKYVERIGRAWAEEASRRRGEGRTIPRAAFLTGSSGRLAVNRAVKDLREGRLGVLCSTVLFDEGTDVPAIDVVATFCPNKGYVKTMQRVGRGLRPKADDGRLLVIEVFDSTNPYLVKHAMARLSTYEEEGLFDTVELVEANLGSLDADTTDAESEALDAMA